MHGVFHATTRGDRVIRTLVLPKVAGERPRTGKNAVYVFGLPLGVGSGIPSGHLDRRVHPTTLG